MESSAHYSSKVAFTGSWPINKSILPFFSDKVKRELSITLYVASLIAAIGAITWIREEYFRSRGAVISVGLAIGGKIITLSQKKEVKIPIKWLPREGIDSDLKVPCEHYSIIDMKMKRGDFFVSEEGELIVWDGELKRLRGKNKEEALTRFFESHFPEYIYFEDEAQPSLSFQDRLFLQWYVENKE